MTGVGTDAPRDLRQFVTDTRKRIVALERRQGGSGGGGGGGSTDLSPVRAGMIMPYAGSAAPTGWLFCDGTAVSRATYSELFTAIGTFYGTGDGSTTFNLPNLKGRTTFGRDPAQTEFDVLGETGGQKWHRHDFRIALMDNKWTPQGPNGAMEGQGAPSANRAGAFKYSTNEYQGAGAGVVTTNTGNTGIINGTNVQSNSFTRMESLGDTDIPAGTTGLPPFQVTNYVISIGTGQGNIPAPPPMPTGTVVPYASATLPIGWLLCDGSAVSRASFSALFSIIGTTYGAGDGSTTFNVPNYKGRTLVGRDPAQTEFDVLGEVGGAKTHTLTVAEMPVHDHTVNFASDTSQVPGNIFTSSTTATTTRVQKNGPYGGAGGVAGAGLSGDSGGGGAHNNLQPYATVNYIISTGPSSAVSTNQPYRGTTAQRNAIWPPPSTASDRANLANQVVSWFNTEKGYFETYYAVSGTAGLTARGLGTGHAAGWYPQAGSMLMGLRDKNGAFEAVAAAGAEPTLQTLAVNIGGFVADGNAGLIVPIGGFYEVIGRMWLSGVAMAVLQIRITRNGAMLTQDTFPVGGAADFSQQTVSGPHAFLANDRVGMFGMPISGSNYYGDGNRRTYLSVRYLGPPLANG